LSKQDAGHWRRGHREPFGHDLIQPALNRDIKSVLGENQIFRIDHYLGKETVQNIMVHGDNAISALTEPALHRPRKSRTPGPSAWSAAALFDNTGTLRDMVPNHAYSCSV
jgi:glucose-6-phosphate 1-dehydrogenase